ncbi:uncharacterized protein LOC120004543 [Tripterygium wilfordii]|uniref:uncharacterized protein LOC120004543 n=1 Tax=Tripterygium wilfordii TaxID=458696 RepID=UPI0018F84B99|nr:uncharacterized protein LOC120004543 [Tripterygium wilfordii]
MGKGKSAVKPGVLKKKYGLIGSLLRVDTPVTLLQAAISYWDPAYRCFTFGQIDFSPTIEEYAQLLQLEPHNTKMYYFQENMSAEKIIAKMLGYESENVKRMGSFKGSKWCFPIEELIKYVEGKPKTTLRQSALALAIYRAILFPCIQGYVEGRVIKLFNQVDHGVNPVPAIICETIRSLNFCRCNIKARFNGCSALLGIWLVSHIKYCRELDFPKIGFKDHTRPERRPILEFTEAKWKPGHPNIGEWEKILQSLDVRSLEGKAPWFLPDTFLYRCGDFLWVPLLGPWGAVSQAPALVFRQIGSNPCIPATHGLLDLNFSYDDGEDLELIVPRVRKILQAWKNLKITNRGKHT